ncbi:MAG: adenosine deaminase family protein [Mucilaginibacter sp.]
MDNTEQKLKDQIDHLSEIDFNRLLGRYWRYFTFFFSLELALILAKLFFDCRCGCYWQLNVIAIIILALWLGLIVFTKELSDKRFGLLEKEVVELNEIKNLAYIMRIDRRKRYRNRIFYLNICTVLVFLIYWIFAIRNESCANAVPNNKTEAVSNYFEKIRNNEALLTAFFSEMPKGGDLHNHYSGSLYAETFWDYMIAQDFYINTHTLEVEGTNGTGRLKNASRWKRCSQLKKDKQLDNIKQRIFQDWSVKDYYDALMASDKHFFDAFKKFSPAMENASDKGLLELKNRAVKENVQYIELMLTGMSPSPDTANFHSYNAGLRSAMLRSDTIALAALFNKIRDQLKGKIYPLADKYCADLEQVHHKIKMDDSNFTMRYLTYTNRNGEPADVFQRLLQAFYAASKDSLIVGVNILSNEDGAVSMSDYKLHMQMFRYCHSLFPSVKYSMHAGELALGVVKPEDLTFHINDAIHTAGASRIGHGVDMAYEKDCYRLMHYMAQKGIAVEINLTSNEFILKVKDDAHPIALYFRSGVPIVISTDDAGILRTNLIRQYVLLAKRYQYISYADIKQFVKNSINYSFIKNKALKQEIIRQVNGKFSAFENRIALTAK